MKYSQPIADRIQIVRGLNVLFDNDLAELYGVPTKALLQAVKRNPDRFPDDFMFRLTETEWQFLRSQIVTSKTGRGGRRYAPAAFTEQGVAMLSSVLNSPQAIAVNIEITRTFVRLRLASGSNSELLKRLDQLESRTELLERDTREQIQRIFAAIRELMAPPPSNKRPIGFITPEK